MHTWVKFLFVQEMDRFMSLNFYWIPSFQTDKKALEWSCMTKQSETIIHVRHGNQWIQTSLPCKLGSCASNCLFRSPSKSDSSFCRPLAGLIGWWSLTSLRRGLGSIWVKLRIWKNGSHVGHGDVKYGWLRPFNQFNDIKKLPCLSPLSSNIFEFATNINKLSNIKNWLKFKKPKT